MSDGTAQLIGVRKGVINRAILSNLPEHGNDVPAYGDLDYFPLTRGAVAPGFR